MPTRHFWLAVALALPTGSLAQEPDKPTIPASETNPATPAAGHSLHGETFNEGPRQAAVLLPGQGNVVFPVTTTSPDAQAFVTQGVAQLHTFYYLEAERSFRQAAKLDPNCVMAYWGMAMANTNNAKRARGFLKEAFAKAAVNKITPREQLYLDGLNEKYKEGGDAKSHRQGWLGKLEAIVQQFPDDLDARCWLAMVTWENSNSGDGIGSRQAVDELLHSVERVAPMHPGMHHYRIHLWDGPKPERAEKSADLYAAAAPGIAHAWHMPGHTYSGLKRYADAAYQQEGSARVDHAAMLRDRIMPFEIHNYAHNNQWLATSLSNAGQPRRAIEVARNLVEQPRDPSKNNRNDGGSAQRSGRSRWSEVLARYELWDDLIAATDSGALDWTDLPAELRDKHYTLGLAYAWKGDIEKTREQITALNGLAPRSKKPEPKPGAEAAVPSSEAEKKAEGEKAGEATKNEDKDEVDGAEETDDTGEQKKDAETKTDTPPSDAAAPKAADGTPPRTRRRGTIDVKAQVAELEGLVLLIEGKHEEALKRLEEASSMRPEAKARAQLRGGKPDLAIETMRKAVENNPNQVPPLACQVEILQGAGKDIEAKDAYAKLVSICEMKEPGVPVFDRLKSITQAWAAAGWQPPAPPDRSQATPTRIDLNPLGSLGWSPYQAEGFALSDTNGALWNLSEHRGRNVIVVFYLGGKCAHCMQQLEVFGKEFEALKAAGTDLVAISTDDLETTRLLKNNDEGIKFPMPLLVDPGLQTFKLYRAHDDFEDVPLHGTFLIDANGAVRFQNISFNPFMDIRFLKDESARVTRMLGGASAGVASARSANSAP